MGSRGCALCRMLCASQQFLSKNENMQRPLVLRRYLRAKRSSNGVTSRRPIEFAPDHVSTSAKRPVQMVSQRSLRDLVRPLIYTVAFSGGCYFGAVIWSYERLRSRMNFAMNPNSWIYFDRRKAVGWRKRINEAWNSLSVGQKAVVAIAAVNVAVFGAWRVVPLRSFMMKYFTANPYSKVLCLPLTLSTFSHHGAVHLGFNLFALYSFSGAVVDNLLGLEQFMGFYLAAGTVASFAGYVFKVATGLPAFSLGASGAILAVLSYTCMKMPDMQLAIIFLPFFSFSALTGLIGIIALDTAGILFRWRLFDHAAHLGGSLFGIWYALYGESWLWDWKRREPIIRYWASITGRSGGASTG